MDDNIKNLRDAQQQSGTQNNEQQTQDSQDVDVQVANLEVQKKQPSSANVLRRDDSIKDALQDSLRDPIAQEALSDSVLEVSPKKPLKKLLKISKSLGLLSAKEAFEDDDPASFAFLLREVRALASREYSASEIELLHGFRSELALLKARAKKSQDQTELTPHEVDKLEDVVEKIINVQEVLLDSDLPFVLEDTSGVEDGDIDLNDLENLDESIIDPTDQEQLLDEDIYLVEIEDEEADDYTRWTEPILQIIAVRDPKKIK